MRRISLVPALIVCLCLLLPAAGCMAQSFSTITGLTFSPLSNGVQIRITADGLIQCKVDGNDGGTTAWGTRMSFSLPDAKNGTGKTFFASQNYPVSYVQLSVPPTARDGIGLGMVINNLTNTSATVSRDADGQTLLITVKSDRTIAQRRNGAGHAAGGTGAAAVPAAAADDGEKAADAVRVKGGHVWIHAVHADIHPLLATIAAQTGFSIAVDDSIDRKVSINLEDADPIAALQTIATGYGLALSRVGGVYMMSEGVPTDLSSYHLSGTQSFRMQNTQAGTASGLLPNFLYSYVHVNSEQNAVVATSPSQMLAKIGSDLSKVDTPSPEISIEALAVEFTDTKDINTGLGLLYQTSTSISSIDSPSGTITYNTIGKLPSTFQANLTSLEQLGKARVRARPRMAAVNGHTANIFIGTQRFIQVQFNQYGQTQTRIQPVDVGVKLAVTPLTGGNGEITTRIVPEVSNITQIDLQTGLPLVSDRQADTTVRVRDGETIAIGGLTLDQEQSTHTRIPVLGDIPILGQLFRSNQISDVKTELVVFITPRILANTDPARK
jgi:type II secretory pathway component GspD/PulD (secretin)